MNTEAWEHQELGEASWGHGGTALEDAGQASGSPGGDEESGRRGEDEIPRGMGGRNRRSGTRRGRRGVAPRPRGGASRRELQPPACPAGRRAERACARGRGGSEAPPPAAAGGAAVGRRRCRSARGRGSECGR